jgi:hypothetical protein
MEGDTSATDAKTSQDKATTAAEPWEVYYTIPVSLQAILDKVDNADLDSLTPEEERRWLRYLVTIISQNLTLTPKQMLTDYDRWLKQIQYYSDIEPEKMAMFLSLRGELMTTTIEHFLTQVLAYFTPQELAVINLD